MTKNPDSKSDLNLQSTKDQEKSKNKKRSGLGAVEISFSSILTGNGKRLLRETVPGKQFKSVISRSKSVYKSWHDECSAHSRKDVRMMVKRVVSDESLSPKLN